MKNWPQYRQLIPLACVCFLGANLVYQSSEVRELRARLKEAQAQADGYKKDAQATDALSKACVKDRARSGQALDACARDARLCLGDLFICQDKLAMCEERK